MVVRHVPTHTFHHQAQGATMNTIVVGTDQSSQAKSAVEKAVQMATLFGAPLHIVTAVPFATVPDIAGGMDFTLFDTFDDAERALADLAATITDVPVTTATVRRDPATALCEEATRLDASLIVVGNKRVQSIGRILGSVATNVAKSAPCDVYIAHTYG